MRRVWLLLRKDALVLRRSPLLLGILLAYPLAIAVLVGLVASYSNSEPRVGFVDQDNLPATVTIGGQRFDVNHTMDQVSKNVTLVGLSPEEAQRDLKNGSVVAVVTVPPGFIANLEGMVRSPQLQVQLTHGTISSRVDQNVQAYAMALTITFLAVMPAAGSLAAERDENVIGRLARGLIGLGHLVWAKIALAAGLALVLGLAIAVAFGVIIEIGGVTGGEPWQRLPLLVLGLILAGGSIGAVGALLGALAREARTASLVAGLGVVPIVFLRPIPPQIVPPAGWGGTLLPVTPAGGFFQGALWGLGPPGEPLPPAPRLRALRGASPGLVLMPDVCLCEYTSHGHCGALEGDDVDNDATLELLARTAVSQAEAGADAVCPSDMMDGRVGAIRSALDDAGHSETPIVSYAAKYASAFYGPFREAAESAPPFGDPRGYPMDP